MLDTHTKIRRKETIADKKNVTVKIFDSGNRNVIITDMALKQNKIGSFRKLDNEHYFDPFEKIIKKYRRNRTRSNRSIKRSMSRLKDMLENYFFGDSNEIFVTLTTEEEVTDVKKMKQYFSNYWNEVKKIYGGNLVYAYVLETQQERNSLHIHCIIKDLKHKNLYIPNHINQFLWSKGQTRITRIKDKLDIDFEIDEETAMADKNSFIAKQKVYAIDKVINYMIKSRSKENIPAGSRVYEVSSKLKKPVRINEVNYGELKEALLESGHKYKSGVTISIIDTESKRDKNKITKEKWSKGSK